MDALNQANIDLHEIGAEFAPIASDAWKFSDFIRRNAGSFYLCWGDVAIAFRNIEAVPIFMNWLRVTERGNPTLQQCYDIMQRITA